MKIKIKRIINCLLGSIITTLVILTISFLSMMFSSGEDGMRKTFFDTLFFESTTKTDGSVGIHFGLTEYYLPIIYTLIIFLAFYYVFSIIYEFLKAYRNKVIEERKYIDKQ